MSPPDREPHFVYDVFRRACPSQTVLDILANKWTHLTVCALRDRTCRFAELQRRIEGITPRMLTQTLRLLERDGLLHREVFAVVPPRVEYSLTPLGRDLVALLNAILCWSEAHVPEIMAARQAYDEASASLPR